MPNKRRKGIVPLARDAALWQSTGWKVLKICTIVFTILGFLGAFAAVQGTGGLTISGELMTGWRAIWFVTAAMAMAGFLFGSIWLIIFKALSIASKWG